MEYAKQRPVAGRRLLMAGLVVALGTAGLQAASAEDAPLRHRGHHAHAMRVADARPLTVRRFMRPAPFIEDEEDVGPGFVRQWNDPRLDTFYGWRLGGDNFYGDERGDPITRGNASLGMIDGYGPANGGYGGPHFDSVGGFHNGPGPGAQEAADYASGSISRPIYRVPLPHYPSLKAQVAALDTGLAGTGQVSRAPTARERWAALDRSHAIRIRAEEDEVAPLSPEDDDPDF